MSVDIGSSPEGGAQGLATGSTIGRYVILSLVGRGAMGDVYAAHDPVLNRKVAIKLLRLQAEGSCREERSRLLLMREAQSIARLSHPNVVVIHDVGAAGDQVFIAMEFVDGHTLSYWILAQQPQWREVLKVFAAAGAGLAAAHQSGLVHRDFKPDNVMIRPDGEVRVMDFGLARLVAKETGSRTGVGAAPTSPPSGAPEDLQNTRVIGMPWPMAPGATDSKGTGNGAVDGSLLHDSGAVAGTPAYMSPEQFHGGEPDARGDQFSFCVCLYEALYGEGPFRGNTLQQRAVEVSAGNVIDAPMNTRAPGWIRKVLLRGLRAKPEERWSSMKELLSRLDENARRLAEIDEWLAERGARQVD
ncbi:MAG: serine/threonine-protein kinase [Myxococcales bacterium]